MERTTGRRAAPGRAPRSPPWPPTASLAEGETWVQESITGSQFSVRYRWHDSATGAVVPTITGSATVTGEARLFFAAEEWQGSPVV